MSKIGIKNDEEQTASLGRFIKREHRKRPGKQHGGESHRGVFHSHTSRQEHTSRRKLASNAPGGRGHPSQVGAWIIFSHVLIWDEAIRPSEQYPQISRTAHPINLPYLFLLAFRAGLWTPCPGLVRCKAAPPSKRLLTGMGVPGEQALTPPGEAAFGPP